MFRAKEQELADLRKKQEEMASAIMGKFVSGERECMADGRMNVFSLVAGRESEFENVEEIHYRYAESQFLRLNGANAYHITQVDYVVNPALIHQFTKRQVAGDGLGEW